MGSPIVLLLIPTFHKLQTKVNFFLKGVWEEEEKYLALVFSASREVTQKGSLFFRLHLSFSNG